MLIGYYCMYLLYYWHYVNIIDDTTRNNPLLRYRAGQRIFSVSPRATAPRENALISKLLKCQVSFLNIHVLIPKEYLITNLKVKGPYHYGPYLVCIRKKKCQNVWFGHSSPAWYLFQLLLFDLLLQHQLYVIRSTALLQLSVQVVELKIGRYNNNINI